MKTKIQKIDDEIEKLLEKAKEDKDLRWHIQNKAGELVTKILLMAIIFISINSMCMANDPWSKQDKIMEAVYLTFQTIDWRQTHYIVSNNFIETNPILGEYPTFNEVDIWFAGCALTHIIITDILPSEWRPLWQSLFIQVQIGYTEHNYQLYGGFKLDF